MIDVIPFGDRQFLVQLRIPTIPDHVDFGPYYEATCEIALKDGNTICHGCIVRRPIERRNVVGVSLTDLLWLVIKTDLTLAELSSAVIRVTQYHAELSEQEAARRYEFTAWGNRM